MPDTIENGARSPRAHFIGIVSSSLDAAFQLIDQHRLEVWDSVAARAQTAGRGQMRRHWRSPEGNIYAALRLPFSPPFSSTAGAVAMGALCLAALGRMGCDALLKWPNDLVGRAGTHTGKLGGILLEERRGALVAGIGINVLKTPEQEKTCVDSVFPPISLAECCPGMTEQPGALWLRLARRMHGIWRDCPAFARDWRDLLGDHLLWQGREVVISDGRSAVHGVFEGVGEDGAALILAGNSVREIYSGSMRLCPEGE